MKRRRARAYKKRMECQHSIRFFVFYSVRGPESTGGSSADGSAFFSCLTV